MDPFQPQPAVQVFGGAQFLGVTQMGLSLGIGKGTMGYHGEFAGWAVIGEGGIGAWQLGIARVGYSFFGGIRIQASLLRSWNAPRLVAENQTFVGLEGQLTILAIGPRVGLFKRVTGTEPGDGHFFSFGVAIGH